MIQYWPPLTVSELGLLDAGSQTSSSSFWPIHNILAHGAQVSSRKWRVKYQLCSTETLLALHPTRSQVVVVGVFFPSHFPQQHEHYTLRSVGRCRSSKRRVMHMQSGAHVSAVTLTHLGPARDLESFSASCLNINHSRNFPRSHGDYE